MKIIFALLLVALTPLANSASSEIGAKPRLSPCDESLHQQVCSMGAQALCTESRVQSISNTESIELVQNSNMMSDQDISKWTQFLQNDESVALLFLNEVGRFIAFGTAKSCKLRKVEQLSD